MNQTSTATFHSDCDECDYAEPSLSFSEAQAKSRAHAADNHYHWVTTYRQWHPDGGIDHLGKSVVTDDEEIES